MEFQPLVPRACAGIDCADHGRGCQAARAPPGAPVSAAALLPGLRRDRVWRHGPLIHSPGGLLAP